MSQMRLDHLLQAIAPTLEPVPPAAAGDRDAPGAFGDHLRQAGSPAPSTSANRAEVRNLPEGDGRNDIAGAPAEPHDTSSLPPPAVVLTVPLVTLETIAWSEGWEEVPTEEDAAGSAGPHDEELSAAGTALVQVIPSQPESDSVITVSQTISDAAPARIEMASMALAEAVAGGDDGTQPGAATIALDAALDDRGETAEQKSPLAAMREADGQWQSAIAGDRRSAIASPAESPAEQSTGTDERSPATATDAHGEHRVANRAAGSTDGLQSSVKANRGEPESNWLAIAPDSTVAADALPPASHGGTPATAPAALDAVMSTPAATDSADEPAGKRAPADSPRTDGFLGSLARLPRGGTTARGDRGSDAEGPRVDAARFVERVAGAFRTAQDRGGPLQLRLSPPELGSLRLEISVKDGTLTAALEAESAAARRVLLEHLPALRQRLAEQNIRIERFDVDVRQENGGSGPEAGPRQQHHEQRQEAPTRSHVRRAAAPVEAPTPQAAAVLPGGSSALDLII